MNAEQEIQPEDKAPNDAVLSMSDEDLLNMSPQEFLEAQKKQEKSEPEPEEQEPEEEPEEAQEEPEEDEPEEEYEDEDEPVAAERGPYDGETSDEDESSEIEPEEVESTESESVNYKAEYEKLLQPFRASKRDLSVKSVEDARRLMQMGADYQFKMQALKPQLKIMRALEKNGLLSEEKVNFYIDLDKKNPDAIKKFLKDKEIDPMEVDLSEESEYQANSYAPSDNELAIDEVLDRIRETESFNRTVDELGNKWDAESKKILYQTPALIEVINGHVERGIYDQIMNVVESERLLGRLEGLNDLMAYKQVGDALQAQNAFKHLETGSKPKQKESQDPKLKARKRAASPTRRSAAKPSAKDFNPLALSDEEFEKMGSPNFG